MSTHKNIDRICVAALVIAMVVTVIFMHAEMFGVASMPTSSYEQRLFDTSRVHTIDIVMDDWDGFLETCENEEYTVCALVIDGEAYRNVAIRAKGNTSLSSVKQLGSSRYSLKIEFDHYNSALSYYGLDKLCLNNIIQDTTYMKDYLSYQLMAQLDVPSPLCSYAYLTVNGEDWGLFLAVEDVEDGFLARNYGSDVGALYKPDSQSMGGGRGDGKSFDGKEFDPEDFENFNPENFDPENFNPEDIDFENFDPQDLNPQQMQKNSDSETISPSQQENADEEKKEPPQAGNAQRAEQPEPLQSKTGDEMPEDGQQPRNERGEMPQDGKQSQNEGDATQAPQQETGDSAQDSKRPQMSADGEQPQGGFRDDKGGPGGGMGSDDVKLKYIDDDIDSYENIFEQAKTDVSKADKKRLIASLKSLSEGTDIESVVDTDEVIRYFVVHNFLCNGDSYTGSMVHNYYLYEKNGQLSMIPWDYNLAFGTFQGSNATETVNEPINSPVSGGSLEDRPMVAWIFADEEYTQLYHQYFAEFLNAADFETLIDTTRELIAPYVEKDPTKFYTYEEFETGVEALKQFCELRTQSIKGQLDGTIPSTSDGQQADGTNLVDASGLTLSDMGSMNDTMGGGKDREHQMNGKERGTESDTENGGDRGEKKERTEDASALSVLPQSLKSVD